MKKYTRLLLDDRIKIEVYHLLGWTIESIGRELGRSKSSISRELSRLPGNYSAHIAHWYAVKRSRERHTGCRISDTPELKKEVHTLIKKRWSPV